MPYKDAKKQKEKQREWYLKNREKVKAKAREWIRQHRRETQQWLAEYKSERGCSVCGEKHPATLVFHHSSGDKTACIARAFHDGWNKKRLMKEIKKCDILCCNCHAKLHWSQRDR